MKIVNESRAFYNTSFDARMIKYATACEERQQNKRKRKLAQGFKMTTEFALPSQQSIVMANPDPNAARLNAELLNFTDQLSDEDENGEEESDKTAAV